jgi:hypothetical protein
MGFKRTKCISLKPQVGVCQTQGDTVVSQAIRDPNAGWSSQQRAQIISTGAPRLSMRRFRNTFTITSGKRVQVGSIDKYRLSGISLVTETEENYRVLKLPTSSVVDFKTIWRVWEAEMFVALNGKTPAG